MDEQQVRRERAQNLWISFERKFPLLSNATEMDPAPAVGDEQIGGLAAAKDEVLTYACAATSPEIYERWGTHPPSGLLLIGRSGVGKELLARALSTRSQTAFLRIAVPRLVIEVMHSGVKVPELVGAWSQLLSEMPPLTVFFDELEFSQAQEIGARRPDLPIGPVMDFLLDLVDRTIQAENTLVVGSTVHPDTLRPAFLAPRRFERVLEVVPAFPHDMVAALEIHAREAEKRAGRQLFQELDWEEVVRRYRDPSPGDWIRILHGVLRRKARSEAAGEPVGPVTTEDLLEEAERFHRASTRLPVPGGGVYL